ncbi:sperm surface protein Sp17 isoform X1 [Bos indicus]|uniref:Sperm autoantigenic protein 17 n=2 Tax=Bos TaxID=9903 RepID=A0A4W2GV84_BOBOX
MDASEGGAAGRGEKALTPPFPGQKSAKLSAAAGGPVPLFGHRSGMRERGRGRKRFPGNEKKQPEPSTPALRERRETSFDPAEWGAKVDDRFYNNHAFKEQESPEKHEPGKENSQTSVKEKTALESPEEDKDMEENAALKIQAAFRGHLAREEVKKMKSSDLEEEKTEENE